MDWYKYIKMFYLQELWTIDQVRQAVVLEKITSEQFQEITGEPYEA